VPVSVYEMVWKDTAEGGMFSAEFVVGLDASISAVMAYTLEDGRARLVTAGKNLRQGAAISIWDGESLGLLQQVQAHVGHVYQLASYQSSAPDGGLRLMTSSTDGTAKVWGFVGNEGEGALTLLRTLEATHDPDGLPNVRVLRTFQTTQVRALKCSLPSIVPSRLEGKMQDQYILSSIPSRIRAACVIAVPEGWGGGHGTAGRSACGVRSWHWEHRDLRPRDGRPPAPPDGAHGGYTGDVCDDRCHVAAPSGSIPNSGDFSGTGQSQGPVARLILALVCPPGHCVLPLHLAREDASPLGSRRQCTC
jgi:hypothetical protein